MELIDLEIYKWKWFHDVHMNTKHIKTQRQMAASNKAFGYRFFWKELGAFVSTLPRQSGKTKMLQKLINGFNEEKTPYIVVVPSITMKDHLIRRGINKNNIYSSSNIDHINGRIVPQDTHLLVDEYCHFGQSLEILLCHPWKTVTMVGTLR